VGPGSIGERLAVPAPLSTGIDAAGLSAPSRLPAAWTDRGPWVHHTPTLDVLGYRFAVRSTHVGIGRYLDEAYAACVTSGAPDVWYSIVDGLPGRRPHALYLDDRRLTHPQDASVVLEYLTWHVNQAAIRHGHDHVLVHAAVAAREGAGVVLAAAMDAGKTTLVAGLIRHGYDYVTDEAAAIHPDSLHISPFPKPLAIGHGSQPVLADLEPDVDMTTRPYLAVQWQVAPRRVHSERLDGPVRPAVLILPQYSAGAPTRLEPIGRVEALLAVLQQTFTFTASPQRDLQVLARFVQGVHCFRLRSGDLDAACRAIAAVTPEVVQEHEEDGGA
jgi:hypothetical protein